jgi:hypothetical protein
MVYWHFIWYHTARWPKFLPFYYLTVSHHHEKCLPHIYRLLLLQVGQLGSHNTNPSEHLSPHTIRRLHFIVVQICFRWKSTAKRSWKIRERRQHSWKPVPAQVMAPRQTAAPENSQGVLKAVNLSQTIKHDYITQSPIGVRISLQLLGFFGLLPLAKASQKAAGNRY